MKMQIIIMLILLSSLAGAGWLLKGAYQDIGKLKEANESLDANNQAYLANMGKLRQERNRLDRLYVEKAKENQRVQNNMAEQLQAIDRLTADACADALVTNDRLIILQRPVWESLPSTADAAARIAEGFSN